MEIVAFRHLWGLEAQPLEESLPRIAGEGYAGAEVVLLGADDFDPLGELAIANRLRVKPLLLLKGESAAAQLSVYRDLLDLALQLDPDGITVHSGRDCWRGSRSPSTAARSSSRPSWAPRRSTRPTAAAPCSRL